MLLVAEATAAAEPSLEDQRRLVGRASPGGEPARLFPERTVRPEGLVAVVLEQAVDPCLLARSGVPGEPRPAQLRYRPVAVGSAAVAASARGVGRGA